VFESEKPLFQITLIDFPHAKKYKLFHSKEEKIK
jgi:hypothetical protein